MCVVSCRRVRHSRVRLRQHRRSLFVVPHQGQSACVPHAAGKGLPYASEEGAGCRVMRPVTGVAGQPMVLLPPHPPHEPPGHPPPGREGGMGRTGPTLNGGAPVLRLGADICRPVSALPQSGQGTVASLPAISSKSLPQALQWYSNMGMWLSPRIKDRNVPLCYRMTEPRGMPQDGAPATGGRALEL